MTWVKVCGLSTPEAVQAAEAAGADAVGFVLVPSSPRLVSKELAADLAAVARAETYLLTLGLATGEGLELLAAIGVAGVQPYGDGRAAFAAAALEEGYKVLYPMPVREGNTPDLQVVPAGAVPLFDTDRTDQLGGTGQTFDWGVLAGFAPPFVVAGGLGADNVGDLIAAVGPWGVDASSSLESSPGVKDVDSIRAFVKAAKGS